MSKNKRFIHFLIIFSLNVLLLIPNCSRNLAVNHVETEVNEEEAVILSDPLLIRAQEIASSLDDNMLAAQVMICSIDGRGKLPGYMKTILKEVPIGGVMLFSFNLNTTSEEIKSYIEETVSLITEVHNIPPFIAVDHEGGTVNRFINDFAYLPDASSYFDILKTYGRDAALLKIKEDSFKAGTEIRRLGINMNFAPVAEPLIDENKSFLEKRSYGKDISFTSLAATAFAESMKQAGVLCVIKHFPVSAGDDPHYSASVLNLDKIALDRIIYPFFLFLYKGEARAIMASHTKIPLIDSEITSLSSVILNTWLRGELGFNGIIISDDFSMTAAHQSDVKLNHIEAAVRSVAAGSDAILVWSPDIRRTHAAFLSALKDGTLARERLLDAAQRIIYEKLLLGIMQ
ncbi:MAG: glycoside hydrolase family 3 protein [Treponema sp.]|nr:glycoside hydrolase family 3 protein [Treponema sp.]MCL2250333.1 glycoside hydrolase family 3 protein [Treponema sp.]